MKLTINSFFSDGCSHYEDDIIRILKNFKNEGTQIGNEDRNSIRYCLIDDSNVNFKSFKLPNPFNRIVYKYFRKSKARRSFEYAHLLIKKNFYTPQPIAFIEEINVFGMASSYYICEHLEKIFTLREVIGNVLFKDREHIIREYVWLLYRLHEHGIEFIDNSSANFLIRKMNKSYRFYMVDLNRMNFHRSMNISKRLANFSRLTNDLEVIKIISSEYASLAGISKEYCLKKIIDGTFRQQFKYKLKKKLKFYKHFGRVSLYTLL